MTSLIPQLPELLSIIASFLNVYHLCKMSECNQFWLKFARNDQLWKSLIWADFHKLPLLVHNSLSSYQSYQWYRHSTCICLSVSDQYECLDEFDIRDPHIEYIFGYVFDAVIQAGPDIDDNVIEKTLNNYPNTIGSDTVEEIMYALTKGLKALPVSMDYTSRLVGAFKKSLSQNKFIFN